MGYIFFLMNTKNDPYKAKNTSQQLSTNDFVVFRHVNKIHCFKHPVVELGKSILIEIYVKMFSSTTKV